MSEDGPILPVWLKLIGGCCCLVLSVIAALIARLRYFESHPDALSYANIAGGGVMLAVAFSHLIPEVQEGFSDLDTNGYPIGFALVIAGYVLILLLEKVIFHHGHAHGELKVNAKKEQEKSKLLYEEDDVDIKTQKRNTIITPLALTIALSIHSLFEGIVFGIQKNHSSTLNVMIAY